MLAQTGCANCRRQPPPLTIDQRPRAVHLGTSSSRHGGTRAPRQTYGVYRCREGHFVRRQEPLDDFIGQVVVARLSRDDLVDLFAPAREGTPDIGVLQGLRTDLQGRRRSIALQMADGLLTDDDAAEALGQIRDELAHVDAQLAAAAQRDPLAKLATVEDVAAWWDQATLARRRTVIELLMEIQLHPIGGGRRLRTPEEIAPTVTITWKTGGAPG